VVELYEREAREIVMREVRRIVSVFPFEPVETFLNEVVDDLVQNHLRRLDKDTSFTRLYQVNLVLSHEPGDGCPVLTENTPSLQNLLGNIEREFGPRNSVRSDHLMIKPGTLLRADGGYLIVEARDLLSEPGAWKALVRTLRTGKLEITPTEVSLFSTGPHIKPEPIDVNLKVVLLGDPQLYYMLDAYDPDFTNLFKVLADFDTSIPRDEQGVAYYAGVLAKIVREEALLHFDRSGIARICEVGARIAGRQDRLTTRFGRLADIAREASWLARKRDHDLVNAEDVRDAVSRGRRRADLPARKFRKRIQEGTLRIQVDGSEVGQVNGLAVISAGPLTYGFPQRITATIGAGASGVINIEREADLSGAIHTKGFYILGGCLRHLLQVDHPLFFDASVAFEQSYGGIDGDSASGAETCCLLSALTGVPLRQDLAMTGAIDQFGHIQPIGAATEKIEGFYDACHDMGLTGTQGVIIPQANAQDLMLKEAVVEACAAGKFHVYAVEHVSEAMELFTGVPFETAREDESAIIDLARQQARAYWIMAQRTPAMPAPASAEE
jgi:lon-related putative ATP-dependent protease